jgi:hypothetical protein
LKNRISFLHLVERRRAEQWVAEKKNTHATAAHEDYDESLQPAGSTNNPYHANEQDNAEDVLDAWKVDSKNGAKFLSAQQEYAIGQTSRGPWHGSAT